MELYRIEQYGTQQVIKYPVLQIRKSGLLVYEASDPAPPRGNSDRFSNPYSGTITAGAAKRIKSAVDILLQVSPPRRIFNPISQSTHDFTVSFSTLTVSSKKTIGADEAYKNLLAPWLRYMKSKAGMQNYIWKAELQARGQIHYHLLSNSFIDWKLLRWKWNSLQKKAGYLQEFAREHKHFNPNSTDIHSTKNVQNIEAYLSKYLCKSSQNQKQIAGKTWDCSTNLKQKRFSIELDIETHQKIQKGVQLQKLRTWESKEGGVKLYQTNCVESFISQNILCQYNQWKNTI